MKGMVKPLGGGPRPPAMKGSTLRAMALAALELATTVDGTQ